MKSGRLVAENRLIILYLLYQMDMQLSWDHICDFAVNDYMDYIDFHMYMTDMEQNGILEVYKDNDIPYYTLTDLGEKTVHSFSKLIPESKRNSIIAYVRKYRKQIKKEYEVSANYFMHSEDEYVVKCCIIENDLTLMELNVTVATKEMAKQVRKNWKENVTSIYGTILKSLLDEKSADELTDDIRNNPPKTEKNI